MPRRKKWNRAVPEGNGPVRHDKVKPDEPTMADLYQMIKDRLDRSDRKFDELMEKTRDTNRGLSGLLRGDQKSRLAMEADVQSDSESYKCMKGAAAERVISK